MNADAIKEKFLVCESLLECAKDMDILEMVKNLLPKKFQLERKASYFLHRWNSSDAW
jgi:hypothetical protein